LLVRTSYLTENHLRETTIMKSATTEAEDADVGSFFAVVLGTLLVAFVLPQVASQILRPKKNKEAESTSSVIEMRMAQREMYRYTKNATAPSVFERYEHSGDDSDDDEEHDFDDEITVQSFLEVHKKGDFPEFRKEEEEEEEEEEVEKDKKEEVEKEEIASSTNNWRCACENGFLPPGLLKTFGGAEAVMRMSTGQCFHKQ
jgi:hypothetical protein